MAPPFCASTRIHHSDKTDSLTVFMQLIFIRYAGTLRCGYGTGAECGMGAGREPALTPQATRADRDGQPLAMLGCAPSSSDFAFFSAHSG